jgi:hypothetical protein
MSFTMKPAAHLSHRQHKPIDGALIFAAVVGPCGGTVAPLVVGIGSEDLQHLPHRPFQCSPGGGVGISVCYLRGENDVDVERCRISIREKSAITLFAPVPRDAPVRQGLPRRGRAGFLRAGRSAMLSAQLGGTESHAEGPFQ